VKFAQAFVRHQVHKLLIADAQTTRKQNAFSGKA